MDPVTILNNVTDVTKKRLEHRFMPMKTVHTRRRYHTSQAERGLRTARLPSHLDLRFHPLLINTSLLSKTFGMEAGKCIQPS